MENLSQQHQWQKKLTNITYQEPIYYDVKYIVQYEKNIQENSQQTLGQVALIENELHIVEQHSTQKLAKIFSLEDFKISYSNSVPRKSDKDLTLILHFFYKDLHFWEFLQLIKQKCQIVNPKLEDEFEFLNNLGKGSQATINLYKAKSQEKSYYAVKTYDIHQIPKNDYILLKMIYNEIYVLRSLRDCEHAIKIESVYESDSQIHIVMEHSIYGNLRSYMMRNKQFQEEEIRHVIRQLLTIASDMQYLNLIHRDIKPDNILIMNNKDLRIRLADFGLACQLHDAQKEKFLCGTPGYMDPSILRTQSFDFKSDIFSIGCIFYFLIANQDLYSGITEQEVIEKNVNLDQSDLIDSACSHLPTSCKDLLKSMLSKNPQDRPSVYQCIQHPWMKNYSQINLKQVRGNKIYSFKFEELEDMNKDDIFDNFQVSPNYFQCAEEFSGYHSNNSNNPSSALNNSYNPEEIIYSSETPAPQAPRLRLKYSQVSLISPSIDYSEDIFLQIDENPQVQPRDAPEHQEKANFTQLTVNHKDIRTDIENHCDISNKMLQRKHICDILITEKTLTQKNVKSV